MATLTANGEAYEAAGVIPPFVANAASIAPGSNVASYYPVPASTILSGTGTLTILTTGLSSVQAGLNVDIGVEALAMGFALNIVNGGPAGGTLFTVAVTPPKGYVVRLFWDGVNFTSSCWVWVGAFSG